MTRKILLGGIAALALSAGAILPAAAQDDDDYGAQSYYRHGYDSDYTMALRNMNDADRIDNAAVETPSGTYAGSVRDVRMDDYGEPMRVGIALRDGGWAWVDAEELRYDPERDVVRTALSYDELEDMGI